MHIDKISLSILLSRLNSPRFLTLSFYDRFFKPLNIFVGFARPSIVCPCLSQTGEPGSGHYSKYDLTSAEQIGRIISLNLLEKLYLIQPQRLLAFAVRISAGSQSS